ncbi:branched-chain amino acid ABC transporter permease [Conexibacter sp. CPCC 206217]|uniref:branched-chain amino acid ABC transporter permease n=1 Tax=Conexibacter sp. CPCC 206217 TaxID=3064574 RepID=UPI0027213F80|nr:branched-chain amino acid ABC transporter permease [Conexibacter sp. CPCC 206217]MDO8210120.1 branched-chain amino acid ABC transporter permease [Conexibacter sp. CPCC 206217]
MTEWINQIIIGLGLAGPILLMSVALSTVLATSRVLNVTVGAVFSVSGVLAVVAADAGGTLLFLVVALVVPVVLYVLLDAVVLRPQRRRSHGEDEIGAFAATLGVAIIITALLAEATHSDIKALPATFLRIDHVWNVNGVQVTEQAAILFGVAVVLACGWGLALKRTGIGKLCRAVAVNEELARTLGVRTGRVILFSWVVSGLLTGVATVLIVLAGRSVSVESGAVYLLVPFAAVVAGGMGSMLGAALASIFFGLAQAIVANLTPWPGTQEAVVFGLLFLLLLLRPEGLVPTRQAIRPY